MQVINSMNSFSAGNREVMLVPNSDRYTLHSQMLLSISLSPLLKLSKKKLKIVVRNIPVTYHNVKYVPSWGTLRGRCQELKDAK